MRRVALIYNPASGQYSGRRAAAIDGVVSVLRKAGIEAEALETDAPGSARALARMAIRGGFDTILACGGDGTVHEVLQSVAGTEVALGVIPLGTANALAQDLGLGRSPVRAVRKLLDATPVAVPVGRVTFRDAQGVERARYFTVAAGVGADALLMKSMDAGLKRRLGYALYLFEAVRIWATHPFPLFQARFTLQDDGSTHAADISQLLAIRIRSFGGALGALAPGASVHSGSLSLISFATRSRLRYMRFLLAVLAGRHTFRDSVELVNATAVECLPRNGSKRPIYVEADGEALGQLPARMEMAAQTLMLLVPRDAQP
ncbi:MAG TPA: diacylglycerol kinase family protein [Terracidiphilus sp.]|jgi:YegS/Rv2252/BmrU family lipid kinase|nr:diacylglycerol kinase family protein [Terracidiphilus sp.]